VWGSRRYETTDASRNNPWLALLTMGEGWHNNHHRYMNSARQGFFWWEVDASYYVLVALSWVGLVWDLHQPPKKLLEPQEADAAQVLVERAAQAGWSS
jgi:stearoyl-CoA desaturase (delta-9 desaturase)